MSLKNAFSIIEMTDTGKEKHQILDCPICLEQFNIPKYLPCLHTFCEACLQTYISSTVTQKDKEQLQRFNCPVCRRETPPTVPDVALEEWAKHFPTNNLISSLIVTLCAICKRNEKETVAKHWCRNCEDPICDECKILHIAVKTLSTHKIVRIEDFNSNKIELGDIEEYCDIHSNKAVEVYCRDHQKICCSVCFATQHRKCESVEALEDIAKKLDKSDVESDLQTLQEIVRKVETVICNQQKESDKLKTHKEEIVSKAHATIEEIKSSLDRHYKQWKKGFEMQHEETVKTIECSSDSFKRFQTAVKDASILLSTLIERGYKKQLFIANEKMRQQISDHMEVMRNGEIDERVFEYDHKVADALKQICENERISDVTISGGATGIIDEISKSVSLFCKNSAHIPRLDHLWLSKIPLSTCRIEKLSEFAFKRTVSMYYAAFLKERIVSSSIDEKSVFIYDLEGHLLHTHKFTTEPYGLKSGEHIDEMYISFMDKVSKFLLKNDRELVFQNDQYFKHEVQDFVFCKNAIVSASRRYIHIEGDSTETVPYIKRGRVPYVTACKLGHKIAYVNDNTVVCTDMNGKEVFRFNNGREARGTAFDLQGNLYVCHHTSSSMITQISRDGTKTREISGVENACNIAFHPDGQRFLVMSWSECAVYKFCF